MSVLSNDPAITRGSHNTCNFRCVYEEGGVWGGLLSGPIEAGMMDISQQINIVGPDAYV